MCQSACAWPVSMSVSLCLEWVLVGLCLWCVSWSSLCLGVSWHACL